MTVAEHFGYDYPVDDDRLVTEYLLRIGDLQPDAGRIFR